MRLPWAFAIFVATLLTGAVLAACNLFWGDVNQDEGWYLYCAGLTHAGQLPYRDFAFTQGPVLLFAYARLWNWIDRWGVLGGRFVTGLLGILAALFAAMLAGRMVPRAARAFAVLTALALVAINVYQSYFTVVVKTYGLTAALLAAGLWLLSYVVGPARVLPAFLGGFLVALAAGTRLSAGAALPAAGLFLLWRRRALGDLPWIAFGVGGVLGLALWAAPFLCCAPEGFWFGLFEYHAARVSGTVGQWLVYKAGFASRTAQAYFVAIVMGIGVVLCRWIQIPAAVAVAPTQTFTSLAGLLWAVVSFITLVHFSAPFPYDDYQAIVYPIFAAAVSAAAVRWIHRTMPAEESFRKSAGALLGITWAACAISAFSSPINQDWFVLGRDRIWWRLKDKPSIQNVREIGRWLGKNSAPGDRLLTQDTYLAVEARLWVPPGLEMGPFSYFPDMPTDRAERLRVLNRERMQEVLRRRWGRFAAFSGYGLAIRSPEIVPLTEEESAELWRALDEAYVQFHEVPNFGQAHTTLRLFRARSEEEP